MPSMNDVLGIIMGGGRGSRLHPLTKMRSKPAVPIAGKDIDGACPLIAFPTDFLRKDERVRQAFETVLKVMIDVFEQALGRDGQMARYRAHAIATLCVGGMVLARSIEDRVLANELRDAATGIALSLGQWPRSTSDEVRGNA